MLGDRNRYWCDRFSHLQGNFAKRTLAVIGVYRPPSVDNKLFLDFVTKGIGKISTHYENIMVAGDISYDCLDSAKSKTLTDIFDFTNLIKSATWFMKNCTPSLVDAFLTNKPNFCFNNLNFGCGVSDGHNLIGVEVKGATARVEKKRTKNRSYKNFDKAGFAEDVGRIPFQAVNVFDDINDVYWVHEWLLTDIINEHAPVKERLTKAEKPAYMNGNLRRAVFKNTCTYAF